MRNMWETHEQHKRNNISERYGNHEKEDAAHVPSLSFESWESNSCFLRGKVFVGLGFCEAHLQGPGSDPGWNDLGMASHIKTSKNQSLIITCHHLSSLVTNQHRFSCFPSLIIPSHHLSLLVVTPSSMMIACHHLSSLVIACHHLTFLTITYHHYHHFQSLLITYHHMSSLISTYHHLSSLIITCHHFSSIIIACNHSSS